MQFSQAPLFTDVAPGPDDGAAVWIEASDGVKLRVATWGMDAQKGTVLLFPGRTEYVEKYGPAAQDFAERGYCTIAIDWRGQGLADRFLEDRRVGHVAEFSDYQQDVAAMLRVAHSMDLPKPWFLVAHSMGGCIGLRAVMNGLPIAAAAFTGPMWGIRISAPLRPVAWTLTRIMPRIGQGGRLAPTTQPEPYVVKAPFEDNMLTTDVEMHQMMRDQIQAHPDLCLGGPSYLWLGEALKECANLARQPAPAIPCATFLGTNERIVHIGAIHDRMAGWNGAELTMIDKGEHEVMMEAPAMRNSVFDKLAAHFAAAA